MNLIGIYSPARGLGSTLIAAHLHYYLREHGVRCCASSHGFRGERPLGLARWQDIPEKPIEPVCLQTLPRTPLGMGVEVVDVHAEMYAAELGELACLEWVIPIRDTESLERGLEIAFRLRGCQRATLVWNAADPELRQQVRLPFGRVRVAESALPESDLLRRADETTTPIWSLPGGADSPAGQAMIHVLREILADSVRVLDAAGRVIGGRPAMLPTCSACTFCDYFQRRAA